MTSLQAKVWTWCCQVFDDIIDWKTDRERNFRFAEEAGELCQSLGMSREDWNVVLDYVYGRPIGEPSQEVGGVMITLYALGAKHGIDVDHAARTEYQRIIQPDVMQKIRRKQLDKKGANL